MSGFRATRCRSCDAPIVWAVTRTGSRMPVDELAKRVEHLRQAHMQRMALASAKARRERAKAA